MKMFRYRKHEIIFTNFKEEEEKTKGWRKNGLYYAGICNDESHSNTLETFFPPNFNPFPPKHFLLKENGFLSV